MRTLRVGDVSPNHSTWMMCLENKISSIVCDVDVVMFEAKNLLSFEIMDDAGSLQEEQHVPAIGFPD